MRHLPVVVLLLLCCGCSAATWQGVGAGLQAAADGSHAPIAASADKLMLFGGSGHQTYLGCLNCSQYASDSVLNLYGTHGSKYAMDSVLNRYGQYGSAYSMYSACSPYASDPPVIVDGSGRFYGRLTVNTVNRERVTDPRLQAWLTAVCRD